VANLQYRRDIDGLRALSVLAVILFHADLGCSGGFVGVDVFYVISGFLITGLILKDLDRGRFILREFWARRVRRILPALGVMVASCLILGWFALFPDDYKALGQCVIFQALLLSNVYFYLNTGYFALNSELMPLLHTWSLAVEEQFYLLFPFFLLSMRHFSSTVRVSIIGVVCVVSFGLSVYGSHAFPSANFYLLPTRAWELGIGAILAAIPADAPPVRWQAEVAGWQASCRFSMQYSFSTQPRPSPGSLLCCPVAERRR
jgi:peptidoglycan/LPS O-acetylase OafA/YrhL